MISVRRRLPWTFPLPWALGLLFGIVLPRSASTDPDTAWLSAATGAGHGAAPTASAWTPPLERSVWKKGVEAELRALMGTGSRTEVWGALVISLDRGDTLLAVNAHRPLAPASNMKLFTSAAALHLLGPEFRYPTYLLADGPIRQGVLHGNLILFGTGDPSLGSGTQGGPSPALLTFLDALEAMGVREIRGGIQGDGSYFEGSPRRESWNPDDLNDWFAAPLSGLSFNQNMITLRLEASGEVGGPVVVQTEPSGAVIPLVNDSRLRAGARTTLRLLREDPDGPILLSGEMAPGARSVWRAMTVSDPPTYAASLLHAAALDRGIRIRNPPSRRTPSPEGPEILGRALVAPAFQSTPELRPVAVHHSAPVRELILPVNRLSHNLYAESLLLTLGRIHGEGGHFDAGAQVLARFLVDSVGIAEEALHVEDGSGLSRLNRASAGALVSLLAWMDTSPHREAFYGSLPTAGTRRELSRMDRTPAAGNLRAKTGTIHRTSALSGFVQGADGERLLFSLLVNDVPSTAAAKRAEDRVGVHLASLRRPATELPLPAEVAGRESSGGEGALPPPSR
jgi:serine-type D-Ala-D-Ala carboxypeptidase/endopeptidase (penicillin-binding protein 4)